MLRLNRMTDYAIVVLGQMARTPGMVMPAPALAEATGVPQPTVARLLKQLAGAGLLASQRGAHGGYALHRPASSVTVAEVIQALEGPIALTACVDGATEGCEVEHSCPMRGNWDRVNEAIRAALHGVSLADMLDPETMFPVPAAAGRAPAGRARPA